VRAVTINLGPRLPEVSSGQPGSLGRAPLALPYLALLRAGFGRPPAHTEAGGLLPHHFTLALAGGMFLCHFPAGRPAWVLPSALPGGARTFLPPPFGGRRSPGLLDLLQLYQPWHVYLGLGAVEGKVGKFVRPLVVVPPHVPHFESLEAAAKLYHPVEERLQPRVSHAVAIL